MHVLEGNAPKRGAQNELGRRATYSALAFGGVHAKWSRDTAPVAVRGRQWFARSSNFTVETTSSLAYLCPQPPHPQGLIGLWTLARASSIICGLS